MAELAILLLLMFFLWIEVTLRQMKGDENPWVPRPPQVPRPEPRVDPKRDAWERAASRFGFEMSETELTGTVGNYAVSVSRWLHKWEEVEISVDGRRTIPAALVITSVDEPAFGGGEPVRSGDPELDRIVLVTGDPVVAFALLDFRTRAFLRELVPAGVSLQSGRVRRRIIDPAQLPEAIQRMVKLAELLSLDAREVATRLARNAASEDLPAVRLKCLQLLQERFGEEEVARKASRYALADRSPEMRLRGAIFLAQIDAVLAIAKDPGLDVSLRVRACTYLARHAPSERGQAIEDLARLLDAVDTNAAVAIAELLEEVGDATAEPALLKLLDRDSESVRIVAARALGHVGTVSAVEALRAHSGGILLSDLKRAAREAIAQIQARLGVVEPGRLSLVEAKRGTERSVSRPSRGGVSLSPGPEANVASPGNVHPR
jgi:hypothetical protein